MSVYDCEYVSITGEPVKMESYRGKVLLIVNVASKCGFTPQYAGLEALYEKYRDRGFIIIGFPCNQFMEQEPGTEEEIMSSCKLNYGVTFPLSKKVEVRGEGAIPLFRYLTAEKGFSGLGKGLKVKMLETMLKARYKAGFSDEQIKWNFTKFLVDREGTVIARYEPPFEPKDIAPDIERLL